MGIPNLQGARTLKEWPANEKIVSAVEHEGKLYFCIKPYVGKPIIIDNINVTGVTKEVMANSESWDSFLSDTWIQLNSLSDDSFSLHINGRVKGAGNTIDPDIEPQKLWPNAVVPYEIDTTKYPVGKNERKIILSAIKAWNSADTGFTFIPRTRETDYLIFGEHDNLCFSNVGRKGGAQYIRCDLDGTAGAGHFNERSIIHEIGHVIGLYHEHQRDDRDNYVAVRGSRRADYGKMGRSHGRYDAASIMHYYLSPDTVQANEGMFTRPDLVGKLDGLSSGDVAAAKYLADCAKHQPLSRSASGRGDPIVAARWTPHHFSRTESAVSNARPPVWRTIHDQAFQALNAENHQNARLYFNTLFSEYGSVFHAIFNEQENANIHDGAGICLYNLGHHEKALSFLNKARELDPRNVAYHEHIEQAEKHIRSQNSSGCTLQ